MRECTVEEDRSRPAAEEGDVEGSRLGKLLSPTRRRDAVAMLMERFRVSQRIACRVVGQPRAT
jgi:hypothetical protein